VRAAVFEEPSASPCAVLVSDIEFFSTRRADLVPFSGVCHVVYLPSAGPGGAPRVLGLSKAARVVEVHARRLQTPKNLADDVAEALGGLLELAPRGALAVVQAASVGPASSRETWTAVGACGCYEEEGWELEEAEGLLSLQGVDLRGLRGSAAVGPASPPPPVECVQREKPPEGRGFAAVERAACALARSVGWGESDEVLVTAARGYARWMWEFTRGREDEDEDSALLGVPDPDPARCSEGEGRGRFSPTGAVAAVSAPVSFGNGLGSGREGFCEDFASLCEHHLLPFHGRIYVACVAGGPASGSLAAASGQVRATIWRFSHRLQLQERLTQQVAEALLHALGAGAGVLVVASAQHHCMRSRGVQKTGSSTITIARLGSVLQEGQLFQELMNQVPDLAIREAWNSPSPLLPSRPCGHALGHGHGHGDRHEHRHAHAHPQTGRADGYALGYGNGRLGDDRVPAELD